MTVAETVTVRAAPSAPELISLLDEAAKAATTLRASRRRSRIRQGLLGRQDRRGATGARAARGPRPCLDRDLCRGAASRLPAMRGAWKARAGSARWRACSLQIGAPNISRSSRAASTMSQSEISARCTSLASATMPIKRPSSRLRCARWCGRHDARERAPASSTLIKAAGHDASSAIPGLDETLEHDPRSVPPLRARPRSRRTRMHGI